MCEQIFASLFFRCYPLVMIVPITMQALVAAHSVAKFLFTMKYYTTLHSLSGAVR